MSGEYAVGQEVWRHDVNENRRGPERLTVTKVGRKLVTATNKHGRNETFRINTGRANDKYGHGWLCTDEQHAEHIARAEVLGRLRSLHMEFQMGGYHHDYSVETLTRVADILEGGAA